MIIVHNMLKDAKATCIKDLELILEKEKVFFSMDRNFEEKIDSLHAFQSLQSLQSSKYAYRQDWFDYFSLPTNELDFGKKSKKSLSEMPRILPKYIVVYYMLAINRISDNFSHSVLHFLMSNLHTSLETKLPSHVAQPKVYNLIEEDTVGAEERRKVLEKKLDGLEKGIDEIDHLLFNQNFTNNKKGQLREEEEQSEEEEEIEEQSDEK
ncbi:unnamed protein product [Acanthosepion pharaonis]|uniref:Dynamin GTPase effector domain-containing protein n=1 Tax=Acanthosepion pharaonis TaxID=158019 RepID=A0A812ERA8_ACAPH|nr:unnamed protein product [Sepia pharaonis]